MAPRLVKQEKNEIVKAVKDVSRKMDDFIEAVQCLRDIQDHVAELNDEIAKLEERKEAAASSFDDYIAKHKLERITEAALGLDHVVLEKGEYDRLVSNHNKAEKGSESAIAKAVADVTAAMQKKLEHELQVQRLENECTITSLKAQAEVKEKECASLRNVIERMDTELQSQKKLTASIARAGREWNGKSHPDEM